MPLQSMVNASQGFLQGYMSMWQLAQQEKRYNQQHQMQQEEQSYRRDYNDRLLNLRTTERDEDRHLRTTERAEDKDRRTTERAEDREWQERVLETRTRQDDRSHNLQVDNALYNREQNFTGRLLELQRRETEDARYEAEQAAKADGVAYARARDDKTDITAAWTRGRQMAQDAEKSEANRISNQLTEARTRNQRLAGDAASVELGQKMAIAGLRQALTMGGGRGDVEQLAASVDPQVLEDEAPDVYRALYGLTAADRKQATQQLKDEEAGIAKALQQYVQPITGKGMAGTGDRFAEVGQRALRSAINDPSLNPNQIARVRDSLIGHGSRFGKSLAPDAFALPWDVPSHVQHTLENLDPTAWQAFSAELRDPDIIRTGDPKRDNETWKSKLMELQAIALEAAELGLTPVEMQDPKKVAHRRDYLAAKKMRDQGYAERQAIQPTIEKIERREERSRIRNRGLTHMPW